MAEVVLLHQVHGMANDPSFAGEGDLVRYPGDGHPFAGFPARF